MIKSDKLPMVNMKLFSNETSLNLLQVEDNYFILGEDIKEVTKDIVKNEEFTVMTEYNTRTGTHYLQLFDNVNSVRISVFLNTIIICYKGYSVTIDREYDERRLCIYSNRDTRVYAIKIDKSYYLINDCGILKCSDKVILDYKLSLVEEELLTNKDYKYRFPNCMIEIIVDDGCVKIYVASVDPKEPAVRAYVDKF